MTKIEAETVQSSEQPVKNVPHFPFNGYAPGEYSPTCHLCKHRFDGDKKSNTCLPCAIQLSYKETNELQFKIIELENRKKELIDKLDQISDENENELYKKDSHSDLLHASRDLNNGIENQLAKDLLEFLKKYYKFLNLNDQKEAIKLINSSKP